MIPLFSEKLISTKSLYLLSDRGFIFNLIPQANLTIYTYIVDHEMLDVLVRNNTNRVVQIPYKHQLDKVFKIIYKNYFQTIVELDLAIRLIINLDSTFNLYLELNTQSNEDLI